MPGLPVLAKLRIRFERRLDIHVALLSIQSMSRKGNCLSNSAMESYRPTSEFRSLTQSQRLLNDVQTNIHTRDRVSK